MIYCGVFFFTNDILWFVSLQEFILFLAMLKEIQKIRDRVVLKARKSLFCKLSRIKTEASSIPVSSEIEWLDGTLIVKPLLRPHPPQRDEGDLSLSIFSKSERRWKILIADPRCLLLFIEGMDRKGITTSVQFPLGWRKRQEILPVPSILILNERKEGGDRRRSTTILVEDPLSLHSSYIRSFNRRSTKNLIYVHWINLSPPSDLCPHDLSQSY